MKKQLSPKKHSKSQPSDGGHGESSWLERNVNAVIIGLVVACVLSLLAQLVRWSDHEPHHHFDQEGWFGFQAAFGFITFVLVVFLGRGLRLIVERNEGYYDRD